MEKIFIVKNSNFKESQYTSIIKIFGDSHSLCFLGNCDRTKYIEVEYNNKKFCIINNYADSVSISGLIKDKSRTNYNNYIKNNLNKENKYYNLFKMGQVDVEYIYYYKNLVKNENINFDKFVDKLTDNYVNFIKNINANIIICGIN